MIQILELAEKPLEVRRQFWQNYGSLKDKIQFIDKDSVQLEGAWSEKKFQTVLADEKFSMQILPRFHELPAEIVESQCVDSVFYETGHWWPRCLLKTAIRYWITERAPELNIQEAAYVSGSGSYARAAIASLINLGYHKINLIDQNEELLNEMVQKLNRRFFKVDFRVIKDSELTLQPNDGSILVNTLEAETHGEFLEDLAYLNFISKKGLVIDIPYAEKDHNLILEAQQVGLKLVRGFEIRAFCDFLFLEKLHLLKANDQESYLKESLEFFSKNTTKV